jgi:hypothetical protein
MREGRSFGRDGDSPVRSPVLPGFVPEMRILGKGAYLAIGREISLRAIVAASVLIGHALAPIKFAAGWKGRCYSPLNSRVRIVITARTGQPHPSTISSRLFRNARIICHPFGDS